MTTTDNSHRPIADWSELVAIRPTQLALFEACPAQFKATLLGEGKRRDSKAAQVGTATHAAIEKLLRWGAGWIPPWSELNLDLGAAGVPAGERQCIQEYCDSLADVGDRVIALEHEFRLAVLPLTTPLVGHLDLVLNDADGGCTIVDHKTNRSFEDVEVWRKKVQMRVYAYAVRRLWPELRPVRFTIGYVLLGRTVTWETDPADDAGVVELFQRCVDTIRLYGGDAWRESVHPECKWCPVADTCQTYKRNIRAFFGALWKQEETC